MNERLKITAISLAITSIIGLTACGVGNGGSDTAGSGTGTSGNTITSGAVTGFGSIFVDRVEFETDSSSFSLVDGDDGPEDEDGLAVGMVAIVYSGKLVAAKLERDDDNGDEDELEGPVESTGTDTLLIAGVMVDVSGIIDLPAVSVGDEVELVGNYNTGTSVFTVTEPGIDTSGC